MGDAIRVLGHLVLSPPLPFTNTVSLNDQDSSMSEADHRCEQCGIQGDMQYQCIECLKSKCDACTNYRQCGGCKCQICASCLDLHGSRCGNVEEQNAAAKKMELTAEQRLRIAGSKAAALRRKYGTTVRMHQLHRVWRSWSSD